MQLSYHFDPARVKLKETVNESDIEFDIELLGEASMVESMKEVQKKFEENDIYTDVLFYPHEHQCYRVIVRKDFYVEFILAMMQYRLLDRVEWV